MHSHTHSHETVTPTTGRTIRWAGHYDMFVNVLLFGREKSFRQNILRTAAIPSSATVLDVGCGTGTLALMAKNQLGAQGKVYGIDAAPEMIEVARHKATDQNRAVDFRQAVIESLPFEAATFDVVLSTLMFHHLPDDLKQRGLAEIYRVLKPGGRLLIVDMRRPTNMLSHIMMAFSFHGALSSGIQDFVAMAQRAGYANIHLDNVWGNMLGALQAQRPSN
jgi:demethylmenaquinone methyltransferase/2-methoxy-6-polyprenyl-1,4-benzoquinol methylase/phosphoethanolamine N-methyltransferase